MPIFGLIVLGLIVVIAVAAIIDVLLWSYRRRQSDRTAWSADEAMYQREAQLTQGRKTGLTVIVKKITERDKE